MPSSCGELVHDPLDAEGGLGPAGAAVGVGPGLVGQHRLAVELVGGELVDRVEHERAEHRHAAADERDVGAEVGQQVDLEAGDRAVLGRPRRSASATGRGRGGPPSATRSGSRCTSPACRAGGPPPRRCHSSGVVCSLPPKPPPTSGAITRIFDSGTPVVAASAKRRMCGIWVADHMVICSPVGSTTTERGSMKAGISRCWRNSRSITTPSVRAFSMASSTSPPVPASAESNTQQRGLVGAEVGVGERPPLSRRPRGLLEVERRGQLLVVDVDELGGVAGLGGAARDHHGDDLAGEGDPVGRHRHVVRRDLVRGDRPGVDVHALRPRRGRRR